MDVLVDSWLLTTWYHRSHGSWYWLVMLHNQLPIDHHWWFLVFVIGECWSSLAILDDKHFNLSTNRCFNWYSLVTQSAWWSASCLFSKPFSHLTALEISNCPGEKLQSKLTHACVAATYETEQQKGRELSISEWWFMLVSVGWWWLMVADGSCCQPTLMNFSNM